MTHFLTNPYPTRPGFGLRVYRAKQALMTLGNDPGAFIFTRSFDNCFENFDGEAVIWALMHDAIAGDNEALERGIKSLDRLGFVWHRWRNVYAYDPSDYEQLSLL